MVFSVCDLKIWLLVTNQQLSKIGQSVNNVHVIFYLFIWCPPGYYCTLGVDVSSPAGNHTGDGGICPLGYKCPGATVVPEGCEAGTYQVNLFSVYYLSIMSETSYFVGVLSNIFMTVTIES